MDARNSRSPNHAAVERAAAEWLTRRDRGFTPEEQDQFFQWLSESALHRQWFLRHEETWQGLSSLAQWRPEHSARPNPDLLATPPQRRRWLLPAALAAAAAALIFVFLSWSPPQGSAIATPPPSLAETSPIERRVLEDGSVVELNRGTAMVVDFTASQRRVALTRGEAHFTVAKEVERPFIVDAASVRLRALGTVFNVRFHTSAVDILVTEGRVAVTKPADAVLHSRHHPADPAVPEPGPIIEAHQRTVVPLADGEGIPAPQYISAREIDLLLSWQPRDLEFADIPLAQIVTEFNRTNRVKLVVDDPELGELLIGATFRSDNVEGFVRLLEASLQVKVERRDNGVIVLRRGSGSEHGR